MNRKLSVSYIVSSVSSVTSLRFKQFAILYFKDLLVGYGIELKNEGSLNFRKIVKRWLEEGESI